MEYILVFLTVVFICFCLTIVSLVALTGKQETADRAMQDCSLGCVLYFPRRPIQLHPLSVKMSHIGMKKRMGPLARDRLGARITARIEMNTDPQSGQFRQPFGKGLLVQKIAVAPTRLVGGPAS